MHLPWHVKTDEDKQLTHSNFHEFGMRSYRKRLKVNPLQKFWKNLSGGPLPSSTPLCLVRTRVNINDMRVRERVVLNMTALAAQQEARLFFHFSSATSSLAKYYEAAQPSKLQHFHQSSSKSTKKIKHSRSLYPPGDFFISVNCPKVESKNSEKCIRLDKLLLCSS